MCASYDGQYAGRPVPFSRVPFLSLFQYMNGCLMRRPLRLLCLFVVSLISNGCTSPSRAGLPPDSPFREPVVMAKDLLPQGIAVGDVTATGALLWARTDGPAFVQVEWAPPSVWDTASRMATVIAPVA